MAGVARGEAQAISAAVRSALDLSGDDPPGRRGRGVRTAHHRHQSSIPVPGRRAARRDRGRRRHPARAASAQLRSRDRRRRGACAAAGRSGGRAGAGRRPRRHRRRGLRRSLPHRARRGRERAYRSVRCHAGSAGDRIWLYPPRQVPARGRLRRREIRREAGRGDGARLPRARLSVELRQPDVRRPPLPRRISRFRCRERHGGHGSGRGRRLGSRLHHAQGR